MLTALAKSVLVPLGLTDTSSATGTAIEKKDFGSGMTTLIFSNDDLNDIMKTIKSHKDSGLLIKRATETVENEIKEQKGESLGMLAATLGVGLLGNILEGKEVTRAGEETIRAS